MTVEMPAGAPAEPMQPGLQSSYDVSNLDDGSLAAVMQSIQTRIAEEAQVGENEATSFAIIQLSRDLGAQHSGALASSQTVFARLDLVPRVSPVSEQIDADASRTVHTLQSNRRMFDRTFLDETSRVLHESLDVYNRMLAVAKAGDLRTEISHDKVDLVANIDAVTRLQQSLSPGVTNMQAK